MPHRAFNPPGPQTAEHEEIERIALRGLQDIDQGRYIDVTSFEEGRALFDRLLRESEARTATRPAS